LRTPNFLRRIFGLVPRRNAVATLTNRLADAHSVRDVSDDVVGSLAHQYRVDLTTRFRSDLEGMYRSFLAYSLQDRSFSDDEIADLRHLKRLFAISDSTAHRIHTDTAGDIYKKSVAEVLSDGRLTDEERAFLNNLERDLILPHEIAQAIYSEAADAKLQNLVQHVIEDERLSPNEERELQAMERSLGVQVQLDTRKRAVLQRLKLYWVIENGAVPSIDVPIRLQKAEVCYAHNLVGWNELRTVTTSYQYGGVTARVKIAKGLYLRAGQVAVDRVTQDVLKEIDRGDLYLTNKRLIFVGGRKNSTIQLKKILDFKPYRNGIQIQKETGKSPFLEMTGDIDTFALTLDRALRDAYA
jgi:hypothetical protein